MVVFPNAKINLGLDILRKRDDGFHEIESVFLPIELCDILEICQSDKLEFNSTGIDIPHSANGNLVVQAWKLLNKDFQIPTVKIHLHKVIPIGAGLGGGSADAAFMLKALSNLFNLDLSDQKLESYAAQIGSDCAFFIKNEPALAKGRGEILSPVNLNLSAYEIVLINPGIHIGTAEAYAGVKPAIPLVSLPLILEKPIECWQQAVKNDFELSIFPAHPEIKNLKAWLYKEGAVYASMSGSGSSVFGIFKKAPLMQNLFPEYFVWTSSNNS